jgi:hypothetical protein
VQLILRNGNERQLLSPACLQRVSTAMLPMRQSRIFCGIWFAPASRDIGQRTRLTPLDRHVTKEGRFQPGFRDLRGGAHHLDRPRRTPGELYWGQPPGTSSGNVRGGTSLGARELATGSPAAKWTNRRAGGPFYATDKTTRTVSRCGTLVSLLCRRGGTDRT